MILHSGLTTFKMCQCMTVWNQAPEDKPRSIERVRLNVCHLAEGSWKGSGGQAEGSRLVRATWTLVDCLLQAVYNFHVLQV